MFIVVDDVQLIKIFLLITNESFANIIVVRSVFVLLNKLCQVTFDF